MSYSIRTFGDPVLKSLPAVLSEMESELGQALQIARVTVTDEAQQEVAAAQVSVTALERQLVEHQRAVQEFTERFKEFKALEEGLARLDVLYAENEERLAQMSNWSRAADRARAGASDANGAIQGASLFWGTGSEFDSSAKIGLILMFGIVVNNAILLINRFRLMVREIVADRGLAGEGVPDKRRAGGFDLWRLPGELRQRILSTAIIDGVPTVSMSNWVNSRKRPAPGLSTVKSRS